MKKLFFIDAAKALGILLVLYTHLNQVLVFFESTFIAGPKKTFFLYERLSYAAGHVGVSLFIVASGFGLAYSYHHAKKIHWREWFQKRLSRIYPLFWLSFAIFLGARVFLEFLGIEPGFESSLTEVLLTALGVQALFGYWGGNINAVYWFITLIVTLYCAFPFIIRFFTPVRVWKILFIAVVSMLCGYIFLASDSIEWFRSFFLVRLFEFSCGIILARIIRTKQFKRLLPVAGLLALILFCYSLIFYARYHTDFLTTLFVITGGPLVFLFLISIESLWEKKHITRGIQWLSQYSYAIYLFHLPFIALYTLVDHIPKALFTVASLAVSVLVSVVAQQLLGKALTRLR